MQDVYGLLITEGDMTAVKGQCVKRLREYSTAQSVRPLHLQDEPGTEHIETHGEFQLH